MRSISVLILGLFPGMVARAQNVVPIDLTQMNLEDLMNVKVTSVSRREQKLSRAAAAVSVINQEDIRRSGATSVPDLLRMVPGVNVEQIDANAWAISIRGFNSRYSNKVLVLIDGRTVYSPLFSGVFWEQLDMPLENIERIEVIRGPGASVWGANAVNGVISIITKSSNDTKGGLVTAGGGSQLHALGTVQYGSAAGSSGTYRVFGNFFDIGNSATANGSPADDHWRRMHGGFRSDWTITDRDSLMVQGDLFANEESQTRRPGNIPTPFDTLSHDGFDAAGGDVLARWTHTLASGSQTSFQTYYDTSRRTDFGVPEVVRTLDFDFQHHLAPGDRHDIVWGLGYRANTSSISPGYPIAFSPSSRTDRLFSAFVQDEIRLSDSFSLTLGARMEHNSYTGFEPDDEYSARLVWNPPGSRQTVWASASKAVREPSRSDADVQTPLVTLPLGPDSVEVVRLFGNPHLKAEEIRDYEAGYRSELTKTVSLDVAAFLSGYGNLETVEPQAAIVLAGSPLQILIPNTFENKARATDYGGEVSVNWNASPRWRLSPGYSYLHTNLHVGSSSQGFPTSAITTDFPQSTFQIRSLLNLSRKMDFDQSLYYIARLPGGPIRSNARLDLRLSRRIGERTEVSLVGQNLLRPRSFEYGGGTALVGTQTVRSVYGKVTWRF